MGAVLDGTRCTFRLWTPNAARVTVMGSFNDWRDAEHPLRQEGNGVWSLTLDGIRAGDEYLYVIDNRGGDEHNPGQRGLRRTDPWARETRHSSGNAVIVDVPAELAASGLRDDPFVTPRGADWLIYQAHVGSFVGHGDGIDTGWTTTATFAQFEQKLSYIRSLGFNALALLPIHENPGDGNEGYAPAHLFAPESSYGSPLMLRHLIRAAHNAGLAVIFDVVWNHMADVDNRLWEFDGMTREGGIFFEGAGRSPWGPRLALWKREVRDLIVAHARMCFEEYHVDGLRIDAAEEIARDVLVEVVTQVRADPLWQDKLLIAEWTARDAETWTQLTKELHVDRIWALADPILFRRAAAVRWDGDLAARTDALLELLTLPLGASQIRYPAGSHDSAHDNQGGRMTGTRFLVELAGGRDDWHARAKARMAWALAVALPGTPMCFMGTECHQPGYWHPRFDANPFHGDHRFDWGVSGDRHGRAMRALVGDVNRLWWAHSALRYAPLEVIHADHENGVVAFLRRGEGTNVLAVVNLGETSWPDQGYRIPMADDDTAWRVVLDSQAEGYGGDGLRNPERLTVDDGAVRISLPRWSVLLLTT